MDVLSVPITPFLPFALAVASTAAAAAAAKHKLYRPTWNTPHLPLVRLVGQKTNGVGDRTLPPSIHSSTRRRFRRRREALEKIWN